MARRPAVGKCIHCLRDGVEWNWDHVFPVGWYPETTLVAGLRKTISWYVANRDWWERIKNGSYREYYEKQYGIRGVTKPV